MRFSSGEAKKDNKKDKYFYVKGQYLDFNSKRFGKTVTTASI